VADDLAAAHRQWDEGWAGVRAALIEALVRAGVVVVDQELFDRRLQVAGTEDEQVVQQLSPAGAPRPRCSQGGSLRRPGTDHRTTRGDRSASSWRRARSDGLMKRALKPSNCAAGTPPASAHAFQT
jgi:hypothetical protein